SLMTLASNRPAGRKFRPQAPMFPPEKLSVLAAQVPLLKGSRTNPVATAGKFVTGSTTPAVTARVVAGSRTVPSGITRFKVSHRVPVGGGVGGAGQLPRVPVWVMRSVKLV